MIHSTRRTSEGFTLIEIVIAIAIVVFMMAAATIGFNVFRKMGAEGSAKSSLKSIQTAINTYKLTVGIYPKTLRELTEKPSDPKAASRWPGALLEKEPEDPWHEPFHYQLTPGKQHPYELYSDGDPDEADRKKIDVWEI
jgi:general secretion pathway protein G